MWWASLARLAEAVSANFGTVTLLEMETHVASANAAILLNMETKANADNVNDLAEDLELKANAADLTADLALKANATDVITLQTDVTALAASADLMALQTQVDALPMAEDMATKAAADNVTALQTQHAINSAALTALESHGTEGGTHPHGFAKYSPRSPHACTFRAYSGYAGDH
jgi:hypothetical protein